MNQYNADAIIQEANEKFALSELESAQMAYQSALLDWVDDAREMENSGKDITALRDSIATLWIEYARLNRKANMFKAASAAYDQAIDCPVAGNLGKIWKEYADFLQERNRYKSAQRIYLRALVGDKDNVGRGKVTDVTDQNDLWNDFLNMMRNKNNDPSLTLENLREAVDTEHTAKAREERTQADILATANAAAAAIATVKVEQQQPQPQPQPKRAKLEDLNTMTQNYQTHNKISAEAVQAVASAIIQTTDNISESAALKAEWLARDGNAHPTRPEPPLFSPSPPKLGDPSGKDALGTELALKLIRLLLNKSVDGESKVSDVSGSAILDIVNGCWMMTALKEKEAAKSQEALDKKLHGEFEKMESELESRLSVAGSAISAVEQMNASEKTHFITMCNQQRQQLYSLISWEFRYLLAIQQEILTKAGIPYFDGPTVDQLSIRVQANICTFLHSAFYLRNRIGEKSHVTMLTAQENKLSSQPIVPMPLPKVGTPAYTMPPPPVAPTPPIYGGRQPPVQPLYSTQPPMPGQFPPPPPPPPPRPAYIGSFPGQPPQNQYQYR